MCFSNERKNLTLIHIINIYLLQHMLLSQNIISKFREIDGDEERDDWINSKASKINRLIFLELKGKLVQ